VLEALLALLPEELLEPTPNKAKKPAEPLLTRTLDFVAALAADLVHARAFSDKSAWNRCLSVFIGPWLLQGGDGTAFAEKVRDHFYTIEKVRLVYTPLSSGKILIVDTGETRTHPKWQY